MKKMMVRLAALVTALALCAGAAAETAENEKWQEFPRDAVYTVAGAGADTLLGGSLPGIGEGGEAAGEAEEASFSPGAGARSDIDTGTDGVQEQEEAPADGTMPYQMTIEDIRALNPGATVIDIWNNKGYLSLLVGKFYSGKVTNMEEGIQSILGMASLLGFGKGCEFYCVFKSRNNTGYTFYTYQQRYGGMTLRNATLRIAVDPEGYTAGLSCSFVPNAGTEPQDPRISADDAVQLVLRKNASLNLNVYTERTARMALPFRNRVFNCWVVYTDNPFATASFDMPYLEHFVTTYGEYVCSMPANAFAGDRDAALDHSGYFDVLQPEMYRTTVTLEDGTERTVEVPVSYNANDGLYYLADPSRRIAVAQYYDFNYLNYSLNFVTSSTIDGWSQNNLLAYANYIIMYDFYASHGIRSVDGFETPILITVGWCDRDRRPVDNACFYGVINGWACFGVSDINHYSDCLDVVGHEYTHGVTRESMQGSMYQNATGAINEAYSDIMGNLAEMSLGYTEDTGWLVGEKTGAPIRDMSHPNDYKQPEYVGDRYYKAEVLAPDSDLNDNGGVHDNNSLLGHIAAQMDQAGMTYEQQISMWFMAIEMMTPLSDYTDLHGALLFSIKMNGLPEEFGLALNRAYEAAGLNSDWNKTYLSGEREGCGRVTVQLGAERASEPVIVAFYNRAGAYQDAAYTDPDGTASALLAEGEYIAAILSFSDEGKLNTVRYTRSGWKAEGQFLPFTVKAGETLDLSGGQEEKKSAYSEVKPVLRDGGYYSLLVPEGWELSVTGQYTSIAFQFYDPENPSTRVFFFTDIAPYFRTEESRQFWAKMNPVYAIGPVLPSEDILGVLATWQAAVEAQKLVGPQLYPDLYDIGFAGGSFFKSGVYAEFNPIESGCVAACGTQWDRDCVLTIQCSLLDFDAGNLYGDLMYDDCMSLYGIVAPADRYGEVFGTLLECIRSVQFSKEYIAASRLAGTPMADQGTISANLAAITNVQKVLYETFGK